MIKNEVPFTWGLALSVAVGLFWRWLLIGALPGMFLREVFAASPWGGFILQLALSFVGLWAAVKWLLGSGRLASMKLMFMEQAHYQELASNIAVERDAPQAARPSP
ncbi:MAG: hypothetical protein Q7U74_08650 [Saprospiraceae bacterium]|nr:hypothetical protein [Saprospiraceae bacterium]